MSIVLFIKTPTLLKHWKHGTLICIATANPFLTPGVIL